MEKSPEKAMKMEVLVVHEFEKKKTEKKEHHKKHKRKGEQWTSSHLKIYSSSDEPLSAGSPALEVVHESMDKGES